MRWLSRLPPQAHWQEARSETKPLGLVLHMEHQRCKQWLNPPCCNTSPGNGPVAVTATAASCRLEWGLSPARWCLASAGGNGDVQAVHLALVSARLALVRPPGSGHCFGSGLVLLLDLLPRLDQGENSDTPTVVVSLMRQLDT